MKILVIPGTNRAGGLSHRLGAIVAANFRALPCDVEILDLREMGAEFIAPECYGDPPENVTRMVDRFLKSDGIVFIVPEYNGSLPGILKLFIDMLPHDGGFTDRACAFIGLSAGRFQGLRAVEHLQGIASYRNAYVFPQRVFIGDSFTQFDDDQNLRDESLRDRLQLQAEGFVDFIGALKKGHATP